MSQTVRHFRDMGGKVSLKHCVEGLAMPAGRPTKYTREMLDKAEEYLTDFEHHDAVFPSHIGLCLYLNINTATLYDWRNQEGKEEFSSILGRITAIQHEMLIGNGLTGAFNSNICKLVLGKHGYKDKHEATGANDKPLIPKMDNLELARRAAFIIAKVLHAEKKSAAD